MKKSLIFWFAAVTCAALFLVGCESPTNGESGAAGSPGPATLPADATPELLEAYFASTDKVFLVDDLDEGTFTVPAGKTLAVVGDVSLTNSSIINAYEGTLDVALGTIDGNSGAVVIVAPAAASAVTAKVSNASIPAYAAGISSDPTEITGDVVLPSLSIGGSGTSAADFGTFAGTTYTVYVKGNLTIDATTPFNTGSAKITVLGETTAKGALTVGADAALGKLTASGALTLAGVSNVGKLDTATSTVTSGDTTVTLASLDSGTGGKLSLTGNVTEVTINGGTGNVEFTVATGALTALSLKNTGTIAFNHADVALSIPNAVQAVFDGNVTLAGGISTPGDSTSKITFNGDVTLADTKAITIGETTASAVTLKAGKSIYAGANRVVTAVTDTAFTAGVDGATLTAAVSTKTLTVGTQALTLTSGALNVATGAKLTLGKVLTVAAGAELGVQGEVSVAVTDGGLTLTAAEADGGAKLSGSGKVTAGSTEIVGAWQAVGASGTIAITYATTVTTITGAAANALTASTASLSDNPVITQKAGTSNNSLTLAANTTVALGGDTTTALGKIVLDANSDPGKLTLDSTSKVLIGAGAGGNNASGVTTITIGGKSVTSTGFAVNDYKIVGSGPYNLVQIGGTTGGTLAAGTTDADDVPIASNSAFTGA